MKEEGIHRKRWYTQSSEKWSPIESGSVYSICVQWRAALVYGKCSRIVQFTSNRHGI